MSRFVSAGSNEEASELDDAWQKAQQMIEATRQPKPHVGEQEGGKSLYDTLQANKAAKQEAFEEQNRLRNQFRSLDEDEVAFLDEVMESTRAKEKEIKKETTAQLDAFRKQQQDDAEKAAKLQDGEAAPEVAETWTVGPRKRKKGKESLIGGVKVRRTSSTAERAGHTSPPPAPASPVDDSVAGQTLAPKVDSYGSKESSAEVKRTETSPPTSPKPAAQGLGLAAYSSDEDD